MAILGATLLLASCSSTAPVKDEPATSSQESPAESAKTEVASLPFNASGLLGGNASPSFGDGEKNAVSVVHVGAKLVDQSVLLFAFRNNTDAAIAHVDFTATARSGGSIVGSGSSQGTAPSVVQSGEVGLAYIYFDNIASIPDDAEYEFQVNTMPADTSPYNTAALRVQEANLVGESIVGGALNDTGANTVGPFSVSIFCFDGDQMSDHMLGYSDQQDAADGVSVSFSEALYGRSCPNFALGVSGWFE